MHTSRYQGFCNNYRKVSISSFEIIQASSTCNSVTLIILLQIPIDISLQCQKLSIFFPSRICCLHALSLFLAHSPSYSCSSPHAPHPNFSLSTPSLPSIFLQQRAEVTWGWPSLAKFSPTCRNHLPWLLPLLHAQTFTRSPEAFLMNHWVAIRLRATLRDLGKDHVLKYLRKCNLTFEKPNDNLNLLGNTLANILK